MYKVVTEDEAILLRQSAQGDQAAFTGIFHLYRDRLYHFIFRLTESPEMSEDVIQDVFLTLWDRRRTLTDIDNLSSYIFRVAQNKCLKYFRKMARETMLLDELEKVSTVSSGAGAEDILTLQEVEKKLQVALQTLSPQQKLVYTLSREKGLKHEEIAAQLNISISTVKNHMITALSKIREYIQNNPRIPGSIVCFLAIIESVEK